MFSLRKSLEGCSPSQSLEQTAKFSCPILWSRLAYTLYRLYRLYCVQTVQIFFHPIRTSFLNLYSANRRTLNLLRTKVSQAEEGARIEFLSELKKSFKLLVYANWRYVCVPIYILVILGILKNAKKHKKGPFWTFFWKLAKISKTKKLRFRKFWFFGSFLTKYDISGHIFW